MSIAETLTSEPRTSRIAGASVLRESGSLLRLALPIMLIALVNMGMSVTDAAMVSALYGSEALAAVAVGSDFYSIAFYLGAGVVGGIAPFYAAAAARKDSAEKARLRSVGWHIVGGVALILGPVIWTAPDWLAFAGLDKSILNAGRSYTQAMALTVVPMLGVTFYRTMLTSAERPKVFLHVTLAMLPLNAAANYVLMMGLGPLPALGPAGAGLSSLLVASGTLGILATIHRSLERPQRTALASWREVAAVLRVGLPIGLATVGEVGIFLAATLYAGRLGSAEVAAHTLALRTAGVAYAIPAALLQASLVRIARAESTADQHAGRVVVASSLGLSLAAGMLLCGMLAVAATPLSTVLGEGNPTGSAAASLAAGLLLMLAAMEIFGNPGAAAAGLLRGRKKAGAAMGSSLFSHWAVGAPLGIVLCEFRGLGVTGLWVGLLAGTVLSAVLMMILLLGQRRPVQS